MDYSKHAHFRWKIRWWLEHLGLLGTMGETALLNSVITQKQLSYETHLACLYSLSYTRSMLGEHMKMLKIIRLLYVGK